MKPGILYKFQILSIIDMLVKNTWEIQNAKSSFKIKFDRTRTIYSILHMKHKILLIYCRS